MSHTTSSGSTTTPTAASTSTSTPSFNHLSNIPTSSSSSSSLLASTSYLASSSSAPILSSSTSTFAIKSEPSTSSNRHVLDRSLSPKSMSVPTSLSEWQLMAVLHRANLVQYYDMFISQGGDDINQIMQCDETEFLEIMSLVRMLPKPLHVRRLQKALSEYSKDQTAFNLDAIQQIGPPPTTAYTLNGTDPMSILLPGMLNNLSSTSSDGVDTSSASPSQMTTSGTTTNSVSLAVELSSTLLEPLASVQSTSAEQPRSTKHPTTPSASSSASISRSASDLQSTPGFSGRATANIVPGHNIVGFNFGKAIGVAPWSHGATTGATQAISATENVAGGGALRSISAQEKEGTSGSFMMSNMNMGHNDFVSLGDSDPNNPSATENPVLSAAQIARLADCALAASKFLPHLPPRLIQNKKRVSKEVLELLNSSPHMPNREALFRKFSAIYGRFDTKRKPHKVLTLHETTVNEAASQLCLLVPALLTRRDELFPLARQIVKDAGYHYAKSRKRPCDPADLHSPISSPSNSPPPGFAEQGFEMEYLKGDGGGSDEQPSSSSSGTGDRKPKEEPQPRTTMPTSEPSSILDQWASEVYEQQKRARR